MTTLAVQNLTKKFGSKKAVSAVSLSVKDGECVALIGPNGAGKTTLINMLVQILKPDNGTILLDEKPIHLLRQQIGYLPQYPSFYGYMTAFECLRFMGKLSNMKGKQLEERIIAVLEQVGLLDEAKKKIAGYSGGMRQRLGIAQAILHKPKLLVLDEPVSALDPIGRREVITLIEALKSETTILFSTHILQDAAEICDHIAMMRQGEIVLDSSLDAIKQNASTSIFEIEFVQDPEAWFDKVKQNDKWNRAERIGHLCRFDAKELVTAREWLLAEALKSGLDVERFENIHESLEQVFMKKVSK
ncbi:ABC transporter ATP-binding protein [Listeria floridensis FSL S10-1187]|uniref:ABC transporter ATP-binding protein n=1 Tax=Listeria floridensis FSL S10-1187 TaxID=1265817 RepID=A0ABN0RI72_9LIST|nr:ABC transporter ATP-binding protein [Listeria floridensis]EUJ33610.1 ABC transporter ATP-binding protein [Listeria floridensis FSL S10-1187]